MTDLRGRHAIVTGSTSGIGLGLAEGLAAAGCHVMLNGFGDAHEIEATRQRMADTHGVQVLYSAADMSKGAEVTAMVAEAETAWGQLDILINNAGIQHVARIEEFPPEKWEALIAIVLSSNFYSIRAALPGMRARGWGRIINIASAHGLVASPFKSAYVAAKHGVVGLTKSIGLETAEAENITCNAICPGYVRTPLVDKQVIDQARVHNMPEDQVIRDVILAVQPTKEFVRIEELAGLVRFLCSEEARSMNGSALSMDGGWTAR